LCYDVEGVAKKQIQGSWTSRPYNFHDPDRTTWWLIPSTDWPAYKFGKFGFWWDPDETGVLLAGFQVEKGVGPALADVFRSPAGRRFITQDDWAWHHFASDVKQGKDVDIALDSSAAGVGAEMYIQLSGGIANDPASFDPYAAAFPRTSRLFVWTPQAHSIQLVRQGGAAHLASPTAGATTLSGLLQAAERSEDYDWMWLSLTVGLRLKPATEIMGLSQHDLWSKCFVKFREWVTT
jgi:hypothetical protein